MSVQAFINGSWTTVADVAAPPGVVTMFAGPTTSVSGVDIGPNTGWLVCNGQAVSRTLYASLFQAISTTWGVGDGVTTFNLPDLREAAPAGAGQSTRTEVSHDNFALGQFSDDAFQGHYHASSPGNVWWNNGSNNLLSGGQIGNVSNAALSVQAPSTGTNGTPRTGNVTRGKRMWIHFVIKA